MVCILENEISECMIGIFLFLDRKGEGAIYILRPLRLLCVHCDSSFYIALQKDVAGS